MARRPDEDQSVVPIELKPHPKDRSIDELLVERRDLIQALGRQMLEISELEKKLYIDSLTGAANRRAFDENFPKLVESAHKNNEPLALLIGDVDGLKRTNKELGHPGGDELLRATLNGLQRVSRPTDMVGRLGDGSDEVFVLLPGFTPMPGQTESELFESVYERYKIAVNEEIASLEHPENIKAGLSFSIAILQPGETADNFYKRVDSMAEANKQAKYDQLANEGKTFQDERLIPN